MSERLQKLIANAGYGSRRWAERLIEQGRVSLNNHDVKLGDKAVLNDKVRIDGKLIDLKRYAKTETKVLILNKQAGFICSTKDPEGRKSVFDLLPENSRWIMIGRLDLNSSGLLLFTNNGELASKLMHPSAQIDREYAVRVLGKVKEEHIKKLTNGVELEDGFAKFHKVTQGGGEGANRWYRVVIREGRKREVRRLWEFLDFKVSRLIRIRFGDICLPDKLRSNQSEYLKPKQLKTLLNSVNLKD
uniref:Pseudouridine synthase n=1 Tax=uncultured marine bacterium 560 TaxID=257395 RepID=Q6SGE5_9BACT|nr:RNA pseudouridylate synthase family protein [uncultured marine bacterium 560]